MATRICGMDPPNSRKRFIVAEGKECEDRFWTNHVGSGNILTVLVLHHNVEKLYFDSLHAVHSFEGQNFKASEIFSAKREFLHAN
jgi:hypothetical protein